MVSTDPAHNLSDAFCQKIGREPTPIHGFDNLSAMEIDASQQVASDLETDENDVFGNMFNDLQNSIPGIDEAMSFSELMKQVQQLDFDVGRCFWERSVGTLFCFRSHVTRRVVVRCFSHTRPFSCV